MTKDVDVFFAEGCGRCALGGTPECRVHTWQQPLQLLRQLLLSCGLTETCKWGVPCYMHGKQNLLMLYALKDYCGLSFLNGALLEDAAQLLTKQGEHVQAGRIMRFTDGAQVAKLSTTIKAYVFEAMSAVDAGIKPVLKKTAEPVPEEWQQLLQERPDVAKAFAALTPGRQRGYLLHFNGAKQSATRRSRMEKCVPKILAGLGFHD